MDLTLALGLAVFVGCLVSIAGLTLYGTESRRISRWHRRIQGMQEAGRALSISARIGRSARRLLLICGRRKPGSAREGEPLSLPNPFATAGLRGPDIPILFQGAKVVGAAACPLIGLALYGLLVRDSALASVILCAVTAMGGWYLPDLWLRHRIENRRQHILTAFPAAIELMVVCVEAGLSLDAAMARVGQELRLMHRELSEELQALCLELRTGRSRQQALRNAALRMQLEEVQSFVSLLIQTERFGTRIGQALRAQEDSVRKRQTLQATEMAAKLPVKLLLPLIFFIFPSLLVVLLGPAMIHVFRQLAPTFGP